MDLMKYYTKCPNREGSMAEREFRITRGVLRSERSEFHLLSQRKSLKTVGSTSSGMDFNLTSAG